MKYIVNKKDFTKEKPKFKIGDLVICKKYDKEDSDLYDFLMNNVGKVKYIDTQTIHWYDVEYQNVPYYIESQMLSLLNINDNSNNLNTLKEEQLRLATQQEIENQPIRDKASKYNL